MTEFSDASWSSPASDLSADDYCKVCLVDDNEPGAQKVKDKCHLPVRATPGGPVNKEALRSVVGALLGARGGVQISPGDKKTAAYKVRQLLIEAKMPINTRLAELAK